MRFLQKLFEVLDLTQKKTGKINQHIHDWILGKPLTLLLIGFLVYIWFWLDPVTDAGLWKPKEFLTFIICAFLVLKNKIRLMINEAIHRKKYPNFSFGFTGVLLITALFFIWKDKVGPIMAKLWWFPAVWITLTIIMIWYFLTKGISRINKKLSKL